MKKTTVCDIIFLVIILTKIYFVRHCEATGNVAQVFQGVSDTDITDLGAKQLEFLKKRFENIPLDTVYSSPLKRAYKTALALKNNRDIEIIEHKGLIELNGGIVEGKPIKETFEKMPELADAWQNHPEDFAPQNGESMRHAYERIYNTFLEIAKKNPGKTVACATHGGVIRCLLCKLLSDDIHNLKNITLADNTAVALLIVDGDDVTVQFYNDASHVLQEFLPKKSRASEFMKVNK